MVRIYTRAGDGGRTSLAGGHEVAKTHPRIGAYGTVDELNACIGLAVVAVDKVPGLLPGRLSAFLIDCQSRLFELGSELACLPEDIGEDTPKIDGEAVGILEAEIDALEAGLPSLRSFILPGGGEAGAALHLARCVCRRAEREVIALHEESAVREEALRYLNRLSDYLFVAARVAALSAGVEDRPWIPTDKG